MLFQYPHNLTHPHSATGIRMKFFVNHNHKIIKNKEINFIVLRGSDYVIYVSDLALIP